MRTRFHSLLEVKINDVISQKLGALGSGSAKDYSEYRQWAGFMNGLNTALKLCEEVERDIDGSSSAAQGD